MSDLEFVLLPGGTEDDPLLFECQICGSVKHSERLPYHSRSHGQERYTVDLTAVTKKGELHE